ncbi:hypothetical protein ACVW06_002831 [Pantoea ananatis]
MISARLHNYVVKAILDKLVRADAENVRFWHKADANISSFVRYERLTDIANTLLCKSTGSSSDCLFHSPFFPET